MSEKIVNVIGYIILPEDNKYTFRGAALLLADLRFPPDLIEQIQPFIEHNFWKPIHYVSFDFKQHQVSIGTRPLQDQIKQSLPYVAYNNLYIQADIYPEITARAGLLGLRPNSERTGNFRSNRLNRLFK